MKEYLSQHTKKTVLWRQFACGCCRARTDVRTEKNPMLLIDIQLNRHTKKARRCCPIPAESAILACLFVGYDITWDPPILKPKQQLLF